MTYRNFDMKENIKVLYREEDGTEEHSHSFFELVYVIEGCGIQNINNLEIEIKQGDYYFIDYNIIHSYTNCKDLKLVNCLFKPEFIDTTLKGSKNFDLLISNYLINFKYPMLSKIPEGNIFHDENRFVRHLFENIYTEYVNQQAGYSELIRSYIIQMIVYALRSIHTEKNKNYSTIICDIINHAKKHYTENVNLGKLCNEMYFTLPYISKKFKDEVGVSFQQYLQNLRIDHGCRLLAQSDKKITEIAHLVGYNDVKFFGEIFKKTMNMSPKQFRLKFKNQK